MPMECLQAHPDIWVQYKSKRESYKVKLLLLSWLMEKVKPREQF